MQKRENDKVLYVSWIKTKLGPMRAVGDADSLYFLNFIDPCDLERKIEKLRIKTRSSIIPGKTDPIDAIEAELTSYFEGTLREFKTPLRLLGSPFQHSVWQSLQRISYGITQSYLEQASLIGKPKAYRAVANANGANQIAIVIPCHRIINANGNLGGYGGGIERKKWLIDHEKKRL